MDTDLPKKSKLNYSLKNIPIPNRDMYLKKLIFQTEKVLQRIRWKTFFFLNPKDRPKEQPNRHGFKTPKNAPQSRELVNFESDVTHLIANIEYRETSSNFQKKLNKDVSYINRSKKIFVKADKTCNVYEVTKTNYKRHLKNNVTTHYEKAPLDIENDINREARQITDELEISDRVEPMAQKEAYITIKDHKERFPNDVKCRLINPAKSNIGRISKNILENINRQIRLKYNLNQWRSTDQALEWFSNIDSKTRKVLLQLDIVDFYPSISEDLFNKALDFADTICTISDSTRKILKNARKSLLFSDGATWQKKTGLHDVTMGSYDGCELCELVGLHILKEMTDTFPNLNFGLYRDDGLGVYHRLDGPKTARLEKDIIALFKSFGLKITIDMRMTVVNFLDVTLNLHEDTYAPFRKPNDNPQYIHNQSNHPRCVIKQVPVSVQKRLNNISSTEEIFNIAKKDYEKALKESGHKCQLTYEQKDDQRNSTRRKKRKRRDEIWFNPPFNKEVKTNIGRQFLRLIDKNFPIGNPLSKILNRKTIKISYSCTDNVEHIIARHNKKILSEPRPNQREKECSCRDKKACPVQNKCLTESVVYKATLETAEYIGVTDNSFKTRYTNHKASFQSDDRKSATTLAAYVHNRGLNPDPTIKWEIVQTCPKYEPGHLTCSLCLSEKFHIVQNMNNTRSLNKRTDIGNKCTFHRKKHYLSHIT